MMIEINNKIEAMAWMIKYLIEEDEFVNLILYIKRGINDIKLISKQIHLNNQFLEDEIKIVLVVKKKMKVKLLIFINIKKRHLIHIWGMSPKASLAYLFIFSLGEHEVLNFIVVINFIKIRKAISMIYYIKIIL